MMSMISSFWGRAEANALAAEAREELEDFDEPFTAMEFQRISGWGSHDFI